eukprot:scaffold2062_cov181-Ochromonas_danica.AAC.9
MATARARAHLIVGLLFTSWLGLGFAYHTRVTFSVEKLLSYPSFPRISSFPRIPSSASDLPSKWTLGMSLNSRSQGDDVRLLARVQPAVGVILRSLSWLLGVFTVIELSRFFLFYVVPTVLIVGVIGILKLSMDMAAERNITLPQLVLVSLGREAEKRKAWREDAMKALDLEGDWWDEFNPDLQKRVRRWVGRRDYLAARLDSMSKSLEESNKDIHEMLLRVEEIKQTQNYNERH